MVLDTWPPHRVAILTTPPTQEPLTLEEAKLAAGLDWPSGDPRDAQMQDFLRTARRTVEQETGVALLTQTYDVFYDWLPDDLIHLPWRPVQSVELFGVSSTGLEVPVDPSLFMLDPSSAGPMPARLGFLDGVWPTDLRDFQPWLVRLVVGHETANDAKALAPGLVNAVALLTAHLATAGRDAVITGTIAQVMPLGFAELIAPYQLVTLA